ncbi:MAG TPA: DNA mismatch repair protein MutS, partial [Chthoniobacteraceae bacterium]|nr:DNA mismatch repair protein MutS [Chthoniobacteraceae bacterium]
DTLLLFRLGDFFEMFFDDAKEAAAILNVALTKRNNVPMCGIPERAHEGYVRRLIKAGKRVAICDQVSEPQPGKIVQREVTQIISPGTVADVNMLDARRNNFLAALCVDEKTGRIGFAFADTTTGDFRLTEVESQAELEDQLARVQPMEVVISEAQAGRFQDLRGLVLRDGYLFMPDHAQFTLREHFKVQSLDGFGCSELPLAIGAAGAIIHYLRTDLRRSITHFTRLQVYRSTEFMVLDAATQANLELVQSRSGAKDTSLLGALDRTVTPMGARKLRDWILHPLCDLPALRGRQQMIADFLAEPFLLGQIRENLKSVRDIERTVGRLAQTGGNARDLQVLRLALEQVPALRADLEALARGDSGLLQDDLAKQLHPLPHVVDLLAKAIVDEPPAETRDGGLFRDGYSPQLDELRAGSREGKTWIAELQERLIEETGIKSLKVRFTSVFGYFIEVTKSNLGSVPPGWHRKQTVATGERFITPELKEVESKILGADERSKALEYELFGQLRAEILTDLAALQSTGAAIGTMDVLASLAETARLFGYCRPLLSSEYGISVSDGRHPVLDQALVEEKFVPNDVQLDGEKNRLLILTGPNMAGKSTYIRQVALLTLMAQIGSWVPARSAEIGLADRIFTRVGANDDLSRGQSTFMVEMNETANICNNASDRSLVILDEIGRGTSTFDGLSIAWSVAEYLHDKVKARTLFATHYHELTELELTRSGVRNYNVAVREWNDQVIFLRKIVKGGADKSYGIQVARLAGLPAPIIARAKEILSNLEQHELNADGRPTLAEAPPPKKFGKPRTRKAAEKAMAAMPPQMTLL